MTPLPARRTAVPALLLTALMCLLVLAPARAWAEGRVLFISASPVAPGKFVALARAGAPLGLRIETIFAEKLPPNPGPELWAQADIVLIDAPREHIETFVRSRLGAALPALAAKPHAWLPTAAPKVDGSGANLPAGLITRLHAYHVNGGAANQQAMLRTLAAHLRGQPWDREPAPVMFPTAAVYHPQAPGTVLPSAAAFLAWKGVTAGQRPPVIAIAMHQQAVSANQTAFVDDLIRRIEAGGALAMAFYSPVMDADGVQRMVTAHGKTIADALINTQITLNPEGRRKEFEALGLPVVQAMPYRRGDAAAWAADPQGVQRMDVPFYLAQAEHTGIQDIMIAAATRPGDEQVAPIPQQVAAVANKALKLVALQRKPAADKRVAVFFWNYPPGEKNLSASFMNLPRSLQATLAALRESGYRTEAEPDETALTLKLQQLLAPAYRPANDKAVLQSLLQAGLADRLPLARYHAWLQALPPTVRTRLEARWGQPEQSSMLVGSGTAAAFVVPRLQLGHVTLLPQPSRGERGGDKEASLYHSLDAVPSHYYLATYLWAREQFGADALVHFGTHGSQEWLPGKERGLSAFDYPMLAVGDVPVLYPYIVDNIGEAVQTKRRGRAVVVSHQTPAFAPAGLHAALVQLHDLLHQWLAQDEGAVKQKLAAEFTAGVAKQRIGLDMGWSDARIAAEFPAFVQAVHDHLHEIARTAQPVGLHTFGRGSDERGRLATTLMMAGHDFWEGTAGPGEEADEMLVDDYSKLAQSTPYRTLRALVLEGKDAGTLPAAARDAAAKAREWYAALGAEGELRGLLAGLAGRYLPTSYGGDPMKNPDALPTGRNLYGFDPSRVPTQAAWEAGKQAMDKLIAAHTAQAGRAPRKLTFTLWSVETMRHFGLLEAQALWALGVEPVWDAGGRVSDVKLVPRDKLGRPRIDVVLSATGLYRDHFPNVMRQLAKAALLAAEAGNEPDNPVAQNAQRITQQLRARGVDAAAATRAGQTRLFSAESGRYGTGLDEAALATDTWTTQVEADRKLAQLYLGRMQYAYGPDEAEWGSKGVPGASVTGAAAGTQGSSAINLYAEHLKGTDSAVLSRSSNLYGMLTTDDPFQYLGGIALAVRHLDGKAPELYIANLRGKGAGRIEGAAGFLAKELATRNFHPGYIQGLMAEGYAGTLQVLDGINNFAGWQSVAREVVRHDQWQEWMDVYVRDKHQLGLKQWFESRNPHALAQSIERLLEAARQGQWQADAASVDALKARYLELAKRYQVRSDNAAFQAFLAPGFGLQQAAPAAVAAAVAAPDYPPADPAPAPPPPPAPPPVEGLLLQKVLPPATPALPAAGLAALLVLLLAACGGAWRARRAEAAVPRPWQAAA